MSLQPCHTALSVCSHIPPASHCAEETQIAEVSSGQGEMGTLAAEPRFLV